MKQWFLLSFKYLLTLLGERLSARQLLLLQTTINYIKVGRWMRDHHFYFKNRVANRLQVWDVIAEQVKAQRVLYLEFGVAYGESMSYWSQKLKHPESMLHGFDSFEGLPESGGLWLK